MAAVRAVQDDAACARLGGPQGRVEEPPAIYGHRGRGLEGPDREVTAVIVVVAVVVVVVMW